MENQKNIFSTLVLEQNPSYVEELEKKYNIELPPIFKAFVQTFEFGKFEPQNEHEVIHTNKKVGYDGFELTLEQCIKVYKSDDQYLENGVIPIASCIYSGGICLGIQPAIKDELFLYVNETEETLRKINVNILEFITQLQEVHWDSF